MKFSIYSNALLDVNFNDTIVTDESCMHNVVHLTVKKSAIEKHHDLLVKVKDELVAFGLDVKVVSKQALQFAIPSYRRSTREHHEFRTKLCNHLRECTSSTWYPLVMKNVEHGTLQSTIMLLMKNRSFRESACAYLSEKRGAIFTLGVLDRMDREWMLRI
jgi:hypothetical protein